MCVVFEKINVCYSSQIMLVVGGKMIFLRRKKETVFVVG